MIISLLRPSTAKGIVSTGTVISIHDEGQRGPVSVSRKGAWGFVVRATLGTAALAGAGSLEAICDALTAEVYACLAALQAAADQGLQNVILETDSQILAKALQSDDYDRARSGMLFREAKYIMAMNFNSVVVVHAPRSCNSVAHELARLGRDRDRIIQLFGCIPSLIL
ncbi:hypothetical protein C2845_PM03G26260 [Panicum miliaceum]|uniref:RNase H type-1 domain-containing protein n=1 Tax=Panicum miliaceum TaxID=4540 RepID=A0A3L6TDI2_PANMI|nr:hypothetical protein C2845_PM03G26260 [Panicum miliaceum]